jgi:dsRNA-specific ribonuclease
MMQFSVNHDCGLALPDLMGHRNAKEALLTLGGFSDSLVRDKINMQIAYTLKELLARKPSREQVQNPYIGYDDTPQDSAHLSLTRVPRRLDFLHRTLPSSSQKPYSVVLPVSRCTVDDMLFKFVQLGLFIPSIMHRYEVYLIAEKLSTTLLAEVQISDLSLLVTAITASSAREDTIYQTLEFLGDSILKMCTSVQLMAEYPLWHEGYLSAKKDRLIANSRLSRAAIETGLDNIIVTAMYPHDLSHAQMHLLHTALVNADFLAYICMEWSIEQEVIDLEGEGSPQIKVTSKSLPLWRFMRHMSKIGLLQVATLEKYTQLREHLKAAIENGTHYP